MKKLSFLFLFLGIAFMVNAQIAPDFYWIQFTDKNDSPYSIDNPEAYLSQRALQRRANQGIAIDEYDIPVNPQYLQAVAACGAELVNPSKWLNGVTVRITNPDVLDAVRALEFVETTRACVNNPEAQRMKERWLAMEMEYSPVENPTRGYYGGAYAQINQLNGIALHDRGYQGEGMVIAILDAGFIGADEHSAFDNMREEGRLLGTRDFVYGSTSVYSQSIHGTATLSTMAGYEPQTFVGTAPKSSYYLIHTEDGTQENIIEEYNWISGVEYADSLGVDVCSTSLTYVNFDLTQWSHPFEDFDGQTAPMTKGANVAASRGMLCVVAVGNKGDGICTMGTPADSEGVLAIGAVDENGNRADFSSVGPTFDGRIKPDVMAMGKGAYVGFNNGYLNVDGTSLSCPIMAGMVACLWQAFPNATAAEIRDVVRKCSDRYETPDNKYGYGIPDFVKALNMMPVNEFPNEDCEIISVYPNPSSGNVKVVLRENVDAEISVCDYMGRMLFANHFNGLNNDLLESELNDLGAGIYFINVSSEVGNQTLKLVKVE